MNILNNIKLWVHSLFQGMRSADRLIDGQSLDNAEKQIGVHQIKDIHRVAPALLNGEITQEVVDLRYRDYIVSENSRRYYVIGDKAFGNNTNIIKEGFSIPKKFSAVNHEICLGIQECEEGVTNQYTLKFEYNNSVRFLLEKYCDHFSVDGNEISFYFSTLPNKNMITSKPFCQYIQKLIKSGQQGGEYANIDKVWFVSYKITMVPNYIKFIFQNLILSHVLFGDNEVVLKYRASAVVVENLIEKYTSEELKSKYEIKAEKHLPSDVVVFDINNLCELCGKEITYSDGAMNKAINGKFCCTECLIKNMMEQEENNR